MLSYNPPRYLFRRHEILRNLHCGENFLEVGAGNLKLAQTLLDYFSRGTIVDFSEFVRTTYKQLPPDHQVKLTLLVGDILELSFPETYDCIVTCEVMEHIEEDLAFLQCLYVLLNSGGRIVLSVPSKMKHWSIHDEIVGHLRRYEKNDIIKLFERAGFVEINVQSYGFPFVNILRLLRILLAKKQYNRKKDWGGRQQTEDSGRNHASKIFDRLGIFINQYTIFPMAFISTLFNRFDWSDGYIVVAMK